MPTLFLRERVVRDDKQQQNTRAAAFFLRSRERSERSFSVELHLLVIDFSIGGPIFPALTMMITPYQTLLLNNE